MEHAISFEILLTCNCTVLLTSVYLITMQILKINPEKKNIDSFVADDFELISYDPHQKIEMKMAV